MQPLEGLLVLDFSTLLPGPMASLILADAGARVVKLEKPDRGDEMRTYEPKLGDDSVNFVLLNRGKQSIAIDLKSPDAIARLKPLIERADVLIEQFRPGVMERLGLGYEAVRRMNPKLVYCSITGWGQSGPKARNAGHDLNYMAETGVLSVSGIDSVPVLPQVLAADIAGGAYPAVMNIMFALAKRDRTGLGCHLDVSMADNLYAFMYWGLGNGFAHGRWPGTGDEVVTGGSPRYQIYPTADGRYLAAAPLEPKFWALFCNLIELPLHLREEHAPADLVKSAVAQIIGSRSAEHWRSVFEGQDVCCSIVATLEEGVQDPQVTARRVFDRHVEAGGQKIPALPTPVSALFRSAHACSNAPRLNETQDPLLLV
ncbi:CoA transferase [Pseudomonas sp. v388]|uniref:CaiB/BaiF CoA transferase family protein n=1 Tax=Pseudomonas sp. v388 TaxID=2479849 RepID=UPI000F781592|nr:CaiB/BaiF CoA-transferase family protein [Pseudomonas sp. v388]RRV10478.1 CoA transferase [Pseudomonas sp. v388]